MMDRKQGIVKLLVQNSLEHWYIVPSVSRIPITEDGLSTTLFLRPGWNTGES